MSCPQRQEAVRVVTSPAPVSIRRHSFAIASTGGAERGSSSPIGARSSLIFS